MLFVHKKAFSTFLNCSENFDMKPESFPEKFYFFYIAGVQ